MICRSFCQAPKSVLTAKTVKLPKEITVTDHFTDLIQHGDVDGDSPALIGDAGVKLWTPMQLDLTANKCAKAMRRLLGYWTTSNPDGDLVIGFCLHTTENVILMMMSILKLGATYFSFSPTYPEQQIVRIVGTIQPLLIVTESDPQILARFDCVKHICEIAPLSVIKENSNDFEGDPNDPVPLESLTPSHRRAATCVLTPGTTGEPRFVRIGHTAILNRLYWQYKAIPYSKGEICCLSSVLVDVESISEIFAPLLGGVPLYLIPRHIMAKPQFLLNKMKEIQFSRITLTPATLNALFNHLDESGAVGVSDFRSSLKLKYLIISGDILSITLGLRCYQYMPPHCKLLYLYGATETTSEATWELFENEQDFRTKTYGDLVSVGVPVSNSSVMIMDEDFSIVSLGTIGEICIAGKCLAMGYSSGKGMENRFVNYPPRAKKNSQYKIFRTGDFGKIVELEKDQGQRLFYEGRTDMVMKIQGREIELNNIVVSIESTELCKECAVLCYHRDREDQAAVAFCVMKDKTEKSLLVDALKKVLEDCMVPDIYPVQELPYLSSGRLDRQKLLKMYKFRRMESTPEDWKALELGIAQKQAAKVLFEAISHTIGLTLRFVLSHYYSSFWEIGGHSLNALIIVHICRENGYLISAEDFVAAETLQMVVQSMVNSSKNPVTDNELASLFPELVLITNTLFHMSAHHKNSVISLLSKCYGEKGILAVTAGIGVKDYVAYIESVWDNVIKENLSVVTIEKETGFLTAAALSTDINARHISFSKKRTEKPITYCLELCSALEAMVRQTTISKEKGKVVQIFMLGTGRNVESKNNVLLIEYLIKGCMHRALTSGFSWALVMTECPLLRDLCNDVLQCDMIAEIKLNSFVAKDKTKPFRKAREHQTLRAYYKLLT